MHFQSLSLENPNAHWEEQFVAFFLCCMHALSSQSWCLGRPPAPDRRQKGRVQIAALLPRTTEHNSSFFSSVASEIWQELVKVMKECFLSSLCSRWRASLSKTILAHQPRSIMQEILSPVVNEFSPSGTKSEISSAQQISFTPWMTIKVIFWTN